MVVFVLAPYVGGVGTYIDGEGTAEVARTLDSWFLEVVVLVSDDLGVGTYTDGVGTAEVGSAEFTCVVPCVVVVSVLVP